VDRPNRLVDRPNRLVAFGQARAVILGRGSAGPTADVQRWNFAGTLEERQASIGQRRLDRQQASVEHYGRTDQMEFFAEMTEAYFGVNDFAPFNRGQLATQEPEAHALMAKVWGGT
jgi:tRNA U38,U39,U40 pseudouridine synthase TruA